MSGSLAKQMNIFKKWLPKLHTVIGLGHVAMPTENVIKTFVSVYAT